MSAQDLLRTIDQQNRRQGGLPEFRAGDSVKVWAKIREGEKTRLQAFEGVCIRRVRKGARSTWWPWTASTTRVRQRPSSAATASPAIVPAADSASSPSSPTILTETVAP